MSNGSNANLTSLVLAEQNLISPAIEGGTLGFSLGSVSTAILPNNNTQVQKITFHNPGSNIIYVCQAVDANNNALTAGPYPGNWQILPGALIVFTGNGVGGPWNAAANTGSGNPLTVGLSQTL